MVIVGAITALVEGRAILKTLPGRIGPNRKVFQ